MAIALSPPDSLHFFGTDYLGRDIAEMVMRASVVYLVSIAVVSIACFLAGYAAAQLIFVQKVPFLKGLGRGVLRIWMTLPYLLIVTILLILVGSSWFNLIVFMIFFACPGQAVFLLNLLDEKSRSGVIVAKRALGFDEKRIRGHYLGMLVLPRYCDFTVARIAELTLLDLGLNYLGVGVPADIPTFGRMFYDGLPFMLSAWWVWFPATVALMIEIFAIRWIFLGLQRVVLSRLA
jgi:peptide/nickel transport system permease protein